MCWLVAVGAIEKWRSTFVRRGVEIAWRVACGGSDRLPARCPSPILRYKYSMEYALLFLRLGRATAGVEALLVELKEEPKEEPKEAFVELKEVLLIFPADTYISHIYRCCWHQCTSYIYIYSICLAIYLYVVDAVRTNALCIYIYIYIYMYIYIYIYIISAPHELLPPRPSDTLVV
jgi:hypothetical protein